MAVVIKADQSKILSAFGVPVEVSKGLEKAGVSLHSFPLRMKFSKDGEGLLDIEIPSSALQQAMSGSMSTVMMSKYREAIMKAVAYVMTVVVKNGQAEKNPNSILHVDIETVPGTAPNEPLSFAVKSASMELLAKKTTKPEQKAPEDKAHNVLEAVGLAMPKVFDIGKMQSTPPCPLTEATMLYEPVKGSSSGSRYFVVAISSELKVAARVRLDGTMSIRIEGALAKNSERISKAGLGASNFDKSQGHVSMHLKTGNQVSAGKALCAVLGGLMVKWTTPTPDVSIIYGKGA